jgi:hypothetical protein
MLLLFLLVGTWENDEHSNIRPVCNEVRQSCLGHVALPHV